MNLQGNRLKPLGRPWIFPLPGKRFYPKVVLERMTCSLKNFPGKRQKAFLMLKLLKLMEIVISGAFIVIFALGREQL